MRFDQAFDMHDFGRGPTQPLGENMPAEQLQPVELVTGYMQRQAYECSLRQALNETNEKLHIAEQVKQEQTEKIDQLTSSLKDQANSTAECRAQLEQLQHRLQERDAAMESLQKEVNSRQDEISRHQWYLGERDADIVRFKDDLAVRDGELIRMQHELDKQHEITLRQQQEYLTELSSLKDSFAQKNEECVSLARLLWDRDAALNEIEHSLEVRDEEIAIFAAEQQERLDEKFNAAANLQTQLEQMMQAKDELDRQASEQQQALASLTRKQDESARQTSELKAQIKQLKQTRDEQEKLAAKRLTQLDQLQQAHQTLELSNKEAVQENELLLLQLHQVQEELEDIFLRNQNLKQAHDRSEAANKKTADENENLSQKLQQVLEELLVKDRVIESHRQRVTRLKQTVSWKITVPLRAVARPFRRSPKEQKQATEEIKLLKTSGLFDEAWYLSEYVDVAKEGFDPVEHFIRYGAAEGRNPSPMFNLRQYLEVNPDVAAAGMNPFIHFVKFGRAEGRSVVC